MFSAVLYCSCTKIHSVHRFGVFSSGAPVCSIAGELEYIRCIGLVYNTFSSGAVLYYIAGELEYIGVFSSGALVCSITGVPGPSQHQRLHPEGKLLHQTQHTNGAI